MNKIILPVFFSLLPMLGHAENSAPVATPLIDAIPAARDVAYPRVVTESVDVTDVTRGIFYVTESLPVTAGPLTLLYPKWLPGNHSPSGQIAALAGLKLTAGGHAIPWRRDPVDVFAFHVEVPPGITNLAAQFQYLAPTDASQGRIVTTPDMLNLEWNDVVLYPAGYYVRRIMMDASVKFPGGWQAATALEVASKTGSTVHFKTVPLDVLVDSPVFAGANVRVETLAPGVRLNIVADLPEQLEATADQIQAHSNLVAQAVKLFGVQHYDHYDFLLALSARQGGGGLEHHRSSENGVTGGYFTDWTNTLARRDLLAHEYTHSWNGKYRRPADLWTPDYRTPMQDDLLWVYEGQTQFWGVVLAARSGLFSEKEALGCLAALAARLDSDAGRKWRPLEDTTDDPVISQRRPKPWRSYQRSEDYYNEGLLVWLDVDGKLRELSHGAHSMDDFARAFFGVNDRDWGELTYTFADVVKTLNTIQAFDWDAFLKARLDDVSEHAPLEGFTRNGYQLIYTNTPTEWFKSSEKIRKVTDFTFSGGFSLNKDGEITDVMWDGPAFNAGLTIGTKIVAVNHRALDTDELKEAIKKKKSPLSLLVKTGDIYRTVELNYDGGLRYPRLEKIGTGTNGLDQLLAPKL